MSDQTSSLSQRVRRLLGTGGLASRASEPDGLDAALNGGPGTAGLYHHGLPLHARRPDTGALFENQIARLSSVLRELHAIDRAREAELRQLRERLAIAEAVAQAQFAERITPVVAQLDALIGEAARLLQPAPDPPPTATLFERMRVRASAITDQTSRESLVAWASSLIDLRTQLATLIDQ